jgi:DNA-binding response OmpR family regulator
MAQCLIDDYHVKPLTPDCLAGRIHILLDHPGPRFTLSTQERHLECLIMRRTGDRVHHLRVETVNGRVVVRGRSRSYYIKQLVLAAVMEACGATACEPEEVEVDIEVSNRW